MLGTLDFGAKRTRYLPHIEVESVVAVVSHPLRINPWPGHSIDYVVATARHLSSLRQAMQRLREQGGALEAKMFYYVWEGSPVEKPGGEFADVAIEAGQPVDAVAGAAGEAFKILQETVSGSGR